MAKLLKLTPIFDSPIIRPGEDMGVILEGSGYEPESLVDVAIWGVISEVQEPLRICWVPEMYVDADGNFSIKQNLVSGFTGENGQMALIGIERVENENGFEAVYSDVLIQHLGTGVARPSSDTTVADLINSGVFRDDDIVKRIFTLQGAEEL